VGRGVKPRLLDLFCGAGGAAMGYYRAGFEVVGVDISPQPDYPFEFVEDDAIEFIMREGHTYHAVHASPPCQAYTSMRHMGKGAGENAPDLVDVTRNALSMNNRPWVMENVKGSPLLNPMQLCGTSFGLGAERDGKWQPLWRHRLFESNVLILGLPCQHPSGPNIGRAIAVYGDHPQRTLNVVTYRVNRAHSTEEAQDAMGIDWTGWKGVKEAIPPAFTEHIGRQLIRACLERAA
jgi:DNA (cytosine-5)-methyltransferase 1